MKRGTEIGLVIAGGGTGGHLFPALAVAKEIRRRHEDARFLFVTGPRKMASDILSRSGFEQATISIEGIKGRGWQKGFMVLLKLPYSFFQSLSIIKGFEPQLVFGVGGYSAGPVCLMARVMGIPTAIHEQNSYPGLTNRLLCRVVNRVFISFEESREHFPGGDIRLTGNPIREELVAETAAEGQFDDRFTILVVGGSQGAVPVNRAFVEALEVLKRKGREPTVIHQTGETDYTHVVEEYRRRDLKGEIMPFIQEMAEAYRRADMVVSRAGASTVSELAALGRPSILIPYPFAANNHQETNALMLVRAGGAEMMHQKDLSGETLSGLLLTYMDDRAALNAMGQKAKRMGRLDALKIIVDQLMEMIQ